MKLVLTPIQWAEKINSFVNHKLFGNVLLCGLRTKCESNNNLMLLIQNDEREYFWVYDYETSPEISQANC